VLGVERKRNATGSPQEGYTRMEFGDGTKLVAISARGIGYTVPVHETVGLAWFGLA